VTEHDRATFHAMLLWIAQSRRYEKATGWAAHKFHDKFDQWPP
jgi:hypothetical protein